MQPSIPTQHTAGDAFAATLADSRHLPASGWSLASLLIGDSARHGLTVAASGNAWLVTATPAQTALWASGVYTLHAIYTKLPSQRLSYVLSTLRVWPDPAAPATLASSSKGPARQAYEQLLAAYRAQQAAGKWMVQEYQIAGRRMTFRTMAEMIAALDRARREAEAEDAAEAIQSGRSPRQRLVVRM